MPEIPWKGKHFSYFSNTACEYFPCHPGGNPQDFNCLFCYCPLYILGPDCGGQFRYLPNGYKDCTACLYPHRRESYGEITARFQEIAARMAEHNAQPEPPTAEQEAIGSASPS